MATFQAFAAPITDSLAHFKAWAQFYGGGFTTIGWVNLAGTGTVNTSGTAVTWVSGTTFKTEWAGSSIIINATNFTIASVNSTTSITLTATAGTQTGVAYTAGFGTILNSGSGAGYTFTNAVNPSVVLSTGVNAMAAWTYRGIWVSGQTYPNGSNILGSGTADLVTDTINGVTYVKITTNVATNLTTAPSANATDWQPYQFEIWKSTGPQTTGTNPFPVYCRLAYTSSGTANCIRLHYSIGCGVDANGNLTSAAQLTPVQPVIVMMGDNAGNSSSTPFEMDFAGDTDNFRFISFRGATGNFGNSFVIDRSRDASGNSTNAFVYCGGIAAANGTGHTGSSLLVNPVMGVSPQQVCSSGWLGVIGACSLSTPTSIGGSVPPFPVFPMPGYVANPCLGVCGFHNKDVTDGSLQSIWMYGASHYYLVNGFGNAATTAALQSLDNNTGGACILEAILWE